MSDWATPFLITNDVEVREAPRETPPLMKVRARVTGNLRGCYICNFPLGNLPEGQMVTYMSIYEEPHGVLDREVRASIRVCASCHDSHIKTGV